MVIAFYVVSKIENIGSHEDNIGHEIRVPSSGQTWIWTGYDFLIHISTAATLPILNLALIIDWGFAQNSVHSKVLESTQDLVAGATRFYRQKIVVRRNGLKSSCSELQCKRYKRKGRPFERCHCPICPLRVENGADVNPEKQKKPRQHKIRCRPPLITKTSHHFQNTYHRHRCQTSSVHVTVHKSKPEACPIGRPDF